MLRHRPSKTWLAKVKIIMVRIFHHSGSTSCLTWSWIHTRQQQKENIGWKKKKSRYWQRFSSMMDTQSTGMKEAQEVWDGPTACRIAGTMVIVPQRLSRNILALTLYVEGSGYRFSAAKRIGFFFPFSPLDIASSFSYFFWGPFRNPQFYRRLLARRRRLGLVDGDRGQRVWLVVAPILLALLAFSIQLAIIRKGRRGDRFRQSKRLDLISSSFFLPLSYTNKTDVFILHLFLFSI